MNPFKSKSGEQKDVGQATEEPLKKKIKLEFVPKISENAPNHDLKSFMKIKTEPDSQTGSEYSEMNVKVKEEIKEEDIEQSPVEYYEYEEAKNIKKELKQESGSRDEETLEALMGNDMATNPAVCLPGVVVCPKCPARKKVTVKLINLKKHLSKVHKVSDVQTSSPKLALKSTAIPEPTMWQFLSRGRIVCPLCESTERCGKAVDLEQHVLKVHGEEAHTFLTIGEDLLGCSNCGQKRVSLVHVGEHSKCAKIECTLCRNVFKVSEFRRHNKWAV